MCACAGCRSHVGENLFRDISTDTLRWSTVAQSVEGRPISLLELGEGDSTTIIFGGFHGDEVEGARLVFRFARYLSTEYALPFHAHIILVPAVNPDGLVKNTRTNGNGVDINRNFPTKNWQPSYSEKGNFPGVRPSSEPETRAVIALLERYKPQRIVTVHTALRVVNYDGPGLTLATAMSEVTGYPVAADIGYPTPGSFGNYAGKEMNIPVITLELPEAKLEEVWEPNRQALLKSIEY